MQLRGDLLPQSIQGLRLVCRPERSGHADTQADCKGHLREAAYSTDAASLSILYRSMSSSAMLLLDPTNASGRDEGIRFTVNPGAIVLRVVQIALLGIA